MKISGHINLRILGSADQCRKMSVEKWSGSQTSAVDGSEDWQRVIDYATNPWICQPVLQLKSEDPRIKEEHFSTLNTVSKRMDPIED